MTSPGPNMQLIAYIYEICRRQKPKNRKRQTTVRTKLQTARHLGVQFAAADYQGKRSWDQPDRYLLLIGKCIRDGW